MMRKEISSLRSSLILGKTLFVFDRDDTYASKKGYQVLYPKMLIPRLQVISKNHVLAVASTGMATEPFSEDPTYKELKENNITVEDELYGQKSTSYFVNEFGATLKSETEESQIRIKNFVESRTAQYNDSYNAKNSKNKPPRYKPSQDPELPEADLKKERKLTVGNVEISFTLQQLKDSENLQALLLSGALKPFAIFEFLNALELKIKTDDLDLGGAKISFTGKAASWTEIRREQIVGIDDEDKTIGQYKALGIKTIFADSKDEEGEYKPLEKIEYFNKISDIFNENEKKQLFENELSQQRAELSKEVGYQIPEDVSLNDVRNFIIPYLITLRNTGGDDEAKRRTAETQFNMMNEDIRAPSLIFLHEILNQDEFKYLKESTNPLLRLFGTTAFQTIQERIKTLIVERMKKLNQSRLDPKNMENKDIKSGSGYYREIESTVNALRNTNNPLIRKILADDYVLNNPLVESAQLKAARVMGERIMKMDKFSDICEAFNDVYNKYFATTPKIPSHEMVIWQEIWKKTRIHAVEKLLKVANSLSSDYNGASPEYRTLIDAKYTTLMKGPNEPSQELQTIVRVIEEKENKNREHYSRMLRQINQQQTAQKQYQANEPMTIGLVGDSRTGKTCLLIRYVDNTYTDSYITSIGMDYLKTKCENDILRIYEKNKHNSTSPPQHKEKSYYDKDALIFVYDITNKESFTSLKNWITEASRFHKEGIPRIIVGTKSDLTDQRKVFTEKAEKFAKENDCLFLETSAKEGTNVNEAIQQLVDLWHKAKNDENMNYRP